jgi:polyhydroxyalkanoate synthesis regulator phasin
MKLSVLFVAIVLAFAFALGTGCKSKEEKVCNHLINTIKIDEGKYSADECKKDVDKLKEKCKNPDVVFDCTLEAKNEEDVGKCWDKCEKK